MKPHNRRGLWRLLHGASKSCEWLRQHVTPSMNSRKNKNTRHRSRFSLHRRHHISLLHPQPDNDKVYFHDIIERIENLQRAMSDSHLKLEGLLQQTSTLLATEHETMAALISRSTELPPWCVQQEHWLIQCNHDSTAYTMICQVPLICSSFHPSIW